LRPKWHTLVIERCRHAESQPRISPYGPGDAVDGLAGLDDGAGLLPKDLSVVPRQGSIKKEAPEGPQKVRGIGRPRLGKSQR